MFPIGTAYVVAIPGVGAQLNYILVADQWRRRGIAHRLIEECRRKWPGMQATNPMNAQAEKLLSKAGLIMSDAVNVRRE
jgi:GNAT superfamily N-acetyltransferase